jgi:hypothetical protein
LTFAINGPVPTLSALFSPLAVNAYSLTVIPEGRGDVRWMPRRPSFEGGTEVSVDAIPAADSRFLGWGGDRVSRDQPLLVKMTSNVVLTARFVELGLKNLSLFHGTGVMFRSIAPTGQVVTVQISSNLVDWSAWGFVTNRTREVEIQDQLGTAPVRFYRLLWE